MSAPQPETNFRDIMGSVQVLCDSMDKHDVPYVIMLGKPGTGTTIIVENVAGHATTNNTPACQKFKECFDNTFKGELSM